MNTHIMRKDSQKKKLSTVGELPILDRDSALKDEVELNAPPQSTKKSIKRVKPRKTLKNLAFFIFVLLPTCAAAYYYAFIAAPIYVSEAQFIVRTPASQGAASGLSSFLQSAGLTSAASDAQTVAAYIASRNALQDLENTVKIRDVYNRPEADFLTRFPNHIFSDTFEYLYWHYEYWVSIDVDTSTNISTLTVYAFRPGDAQAIANRLVELTEQYVNAMNKRAFDDTVNVARREVESLQSQATDIQTQITNFRNSELMLDPAATSAAAMSRLATLQATLVSTQTLLSQISRNAPMSPQIATLNTQISTLQEQIRLEKLKNSGGDDTLAPKMAVYNQLILKQQFTQQMLQSSLAALQAAETTVQSQRLYLEHIEAATQQDIPWYPMRFLSTLLVGLSCFGVYAIGRMLVAATREHVVG